MQIKRLLSMLFSVIMLFSQSAYAIEETEENSNIYVEELVQEEASTEPITHTETITELPPILDFDPDEENQESPIATVSLDDSTWERMLAMQYGENFSAPKENLTSGQNVSGYTNRLTVTETDLTLKGKNGLDLNIVRQHDNQFSNKIMYVSNERTDSTNIRYIYTFINTKTNEAVKIGFYSKDEFYTYAYNGLCVTEMYDGWLDANDEYYRFDLLYQYVTEPNETSVDLVYDSTVEVYQRNERIYDMKSNGYYRILPDNNKIGHGWRFVFPEAYMHRDIYERTSGTGYRKYYCLYVCGFKDINGNIVTFDGIENLYFNETNQTGTYSSTFSSPTNNFFTFKSFYAEQYLWENGPTYNFVAYDSRGLTYYMKDAARYADSLSTVHTINIVAVKDIYGNMIQYQRGNNGISKIIDTYGREILFTNDESGNKVISYVEDGEEKTIVYSLQTLEPEALNNDSCLKGKNVNRFTVTNEEGEHTIYDSRATEVLEFYSYTYENEFFEIADPMEAEIYPYSGYNIERIKYPTGAETHYKYKQLYFNDLVSDITKGRYVLSGSYDLIGDTRYNEKEYILDRDAYTFEITKNNISEQTKEVYDYDDDGMLTIVEKTPIDESDPSVLENFAYNSHYYLTAKAIRENYATLSCQYSYSTSGRYPNAPLSESNNKKRIQYVYHVVNSRMTDMPKTISYQYLIGNSRYVDFAVNTTLTEDGKSIETVSTYQEGQYTYIKYTYNDCGEVVKTEEWAEDTNGDFIPNEGDKFVITQMSYMQNTNGTEYVLGVINDIINADGVNVGNVSTGYTYDIHGNPISQTDPKGNITSIEYDNIGRPIKYIFPDGAVSTVEYNTEQMYTIVTDAVGKQTKNTYDALGYITQKAFKEGEEWKVLEEYKYDTAHRLTENRKHIDSNLVITEKYSYDSIGKLAKKEVYSGNTLSYSESYSYSGVGGTKNLKDTTTTTTANGVTVAKKKEYHDVYGNLVKTELIGEDETITTSSTYDYLDRMTSETDPNGNTITYEYDCVGNNIKITDSRGYVTTMEYDPLGRMTRKTDAKGSTVEYSYDNMGRLIVQSTPFDGEIKSKIKNYYDVNSNLITQKVQNNKPNEAESYRTINYSYDIRNRVINANGDTTPVSYTYDIGGRMTSQTVGNDIPSVTSYVYDMHGNMIKETDSLGQSASYRYNYAGNVTDSTDKNGSNIYVNYGIFGITSKVLTDSSGAYEETRYTYDSIGKVSEILKQSAETGLNDITNYTYDEFGRVVSELQTNYDEKVSYETTEHNYTYDSNSNIIQSIIKEDGNIVENISYTYNEENMLTEVGFDDKIVTYTYDELGNITSKATNGVTTGYTYNKANIPVSMLNSKGENVYNSYSYGYSLDGNRVSDVDNVNNITKSYTYDLKGQLVSETQSGAESFTQSYSYDSRGNRVQSTNGNEVKTFVYDLNNRLTNEIVKPDGENVSKEINYFYDENGNRTLKQTMTYLSEGEDEISLTQTPVGIEQYIYNLNNQLTGYINGETEAEYGYKGDGTRKYKTVNGETTSYLWNGANLAAEITSDTTNKYYYGADGIVSATTGGADRYYLKNVHGDIMGAIDGNGTLLQSNNYDAFGNRLTDNTDPFGYCGEYYDVETGNIYLRNRYYDSAIGQFITEDPIKDGLNWYGYCNNDPVNRIDPEGTASFKEKWDALWKVGPFDAVSINNIGNSTLIAAQKYALEKGLTSVTDNIADAYRHFSWNYDAVKKGISVEDVMQATTNHEVLTQKYMGKDSNGIKYYKVALSSLMDLQNNKVGRYQATLDENKHKTSREVFDQLASYGGVVTSLEHVKQIWGIKDDWLYSAIDGVRGEVSVLIKNGLEENALNIEAVNKNEIKFK